MLKLRSLAPLLGIGLLTGSTLLADDAPAGGDKAALFDALDADGDGVVKAADLDDAQKKAFERMLRIGDADENGELTRKEFLDATNRKGPKPQAPERDVAADRERAKSMMSQWDGNGDGKLTLEELPPPVQERMKPLFERLGKDEIEIDKLVAMRGGAGRDGGDRAGRRPEPGAMFDRLDQNGDGKVTVDEVPERAQRFVKMLLERAGKGEGDALTKDDLKDIGRRPDGDRDRRPMMNRDGDNPPRDGGPRDGGPRRGGPAFMRELDTNDDGKLSKEELAKAATLIEKLDQDGDGSLDPREMFGAPRDGMRPERGPRPDGEMRGPRGDRKPDGEVRGPRKDGDQKPEMNRGDRPERPEGRRRPMGRGGEGFATQMISRLDKNGDSKISKEEAPERMKRGFDRLDGNSDGFITADELGRMLGRRGEGDGNRPRGPQRGENKPE